MISDPHKEFKVKIDGLETRVFAYGDPKNPPIIFIHGYFRSFSTYIGDLPIRYLMKNYYVIAMDLPKFGWSKAFKGDNKEFIYQIQNQILKDKKVNLFGVSYGGLVALEYASKYPKKVNSLIIAGTPVFYGLFGILQIARVLPKYQGKKLTKEVFEEFKFLNPENLKNIDAPVFLFYSRRDLAANTFMGKRLHKMLPNSKLVITKGLSHRWLLHRIDKSGLLDEINLFLANS
jgi:pimeloyl-ACP methyl ester carboxylesterase